jgi:hypothetical protein
MSPQERRRQEEADGVVAVPPLHQAVGEAGVDRVAAAERGGHRRAVHDVQHRDHDHERHVEPDRHVHVLHAAIEDRHEEVDRERHPHHRDGDVDGPDQLRVFLALREAQREGHRGGDDDGLPAPEVEPAQGVAPHARLEQALHGVVDRGEDDVAAEREDDGVGVQRPKAPEGRPLEAEVGRPVGDLERDDHADEHAHDAEHDGGAEEESGDLFVVFDCTPDGRHEGNLRHTGGSWFGCGHDRLAGQDGSTGGVPSTRQALGPGAAKGPRHTTF